MQMQMQMRMQVGKAGSFEIRGSDGDGRWNWPPLRLTALPPCATRFRVGENLPSQSRLLQPILHYPLANAGLANTRDACTIEGTGVLWV